MTLTSAPVSVVTTMESPVTDLIVPTTFTLDFGADAGWVPAFCAAEHCRAASKATQTTTTNVATGLRIRVMAGILLDQLRNWSSRAKVRVERRFSAALQRTSKNKRLQPAALLPTRLQT